jgi:hypothetical protein
MSLKPQLKIGDGRDGRFGLMRTSESRKSALELVAAS